ncbi:MAG: L-threonylcarbamoyladenylate synthase [Patescibacteria group bacterium]
MEIIPESKKAFEKAVEILRSGGVVAHATDTCYGFAASIKSSKGVKKIYALKKMSITKPVSILVSNYEEAMLYGTWSEIAEELADLYWPGALTIVVRRSGLLPPYVNKGIKTIGFRVPKHTLSINLVKSLGMPITTTSANITGMMCAYSVSEIVEQFENEKAKPDLIIDSGRLSKSKKPSTVIECLYDNIRIIRSGDITPRLA